MVAKWIVSLNEVLKQNYVQTEGLEGLLWV